jgi:hypothetical protein
MKIETVDFFYLSMNPTFTTHLALSASLQPYAGSAADNLCEHPA